MESVVLPKSVIHEIELLKERKLSLIYALQYDSLYVNILNFVFNNEKNHNLSNYNHERLLELANAFEYGVRANEMG